MASSCTGANSKGTFICNNDVIELLLKSLHKYKSGMSYQKKTSAVLDRHYAVS